MKSFRIGKQEYKVNDKIINIIFLFLLAIAVIVLALNGFDKTQHIYIKCNATPTYAFINGSGMFLAQCENPLYKNYPICYSIDEGEMCLEEYLPNGYTHGRPPPKILEWFPILCLILILGGFTLNNFLYNKSFNFEEVNIDNEKKENESEKENNKK